MRPALVIVALWPLWAISWFGTAWWAAPTEKNIDSHRELAYRVVLAVGSVALSFRRTAIRDRCGCGVSLGSARGDVWR
jgi:hypothetical protein